MSSSFCLKLVSFFRAALVSCSSFVSLRAVYRDCLVRVASLFRPVTLGFASGEADTAITASPMLRVSKRLPLTYFASQKLRQGPAQLVAPTPKQARLRQRRNHLIDHYRDLTRDFGADRVHSTSHDRGNGLEV